MLTRKHHDALSSILKSYALNLQPSHLPDTIGTSLMVGVAQLVERRIVVPVAVGSNPTTHPIENKSLTKFDTRTL